MLRRVGAIWGVVGILALLGFAVWRLTPLALEAIMMGLTGWQWTVMIAWTLFMVISEGYDGFYKRLAPRVADRAQEIREKGKRLDIVLAPLYCFGYFRAPLHRMIVSYTAIILIICAVIVVQQVAQPWRGIIDMGVVVGLLCGMISIAIVSLRNATR